MTTELTAPPNPQLEAIRQRLGLLEECLLAKDPQMKVHLGEIHRTLIAHEELVHLLSVEEIGKIMEKQQLVTDTSLIAATTGGGTKKAGAVKKSTGLTLGDL
jgi:hypothetical protein